MAKDQYGNGLVYVGDEDQASVYHMYLDDRVVLHVRVHANDPQLRIRFARPDWTETVTMPHVRDDGGHAHMVLRTRKTGPGEGDVEVVERISGASVQAYVYAALPWLLADAYAPKIEVTT